MANIKSFLVEKVKPIGIGLGITVILVGGLIGGLTETKSSSGSSSYDSGDWSSYTDLGEYIVKTDESGAMPPLTKQQLKNAIDKCYTSNKNTHDNYISLLDEFIAIQDKYKVNAAFAIGVMQWESTGGTYGQLITQGTNNCYSIKSNSNTGWYGIDNSWYVVYDSMADCVDAFGALIHDNYFSEKRYTVTTVGEKYNAGNWESNVKNELDRMYATVEIEGGSFNGESYKYAGKTYKLFNQKDYQDSFAGSTIAENGCGVTSVAIIVSAYKSGENPPSIAKSCEPKYGNTVTPKYGYVNPNGVFHRYLGDYGLKCVEYEGFNGDNILKHLKSGKAVIYNYGGYLKMNDGRGFGTSGHFVTLLGLEGDNIFVGDPAGYSGETTMANIMAAGPKRYFLVDKK